MLMEDRPATPRNPPLIRRSLPPSLDLADPRALAWEIVRRRADYRTAPAKVVRIGHAGLIDLICPADAPRPWGLRFRRGS
jgi:hypothetical protein